jgi:hypothetical protein
MTETTDTRPDAPTDEEFANLGSAYRLSPEQIAYCDEQETLGWPAETSEDAVVEHSEESHNDGTSVYDCETCMKARSAARNARIEAKKVRGERGYQHWMEERRENKESIRTAREGVLNLLAEHGVKVADSESLSLQELQDMLVKAILKAEGK